MFEVDVKNHDRSGGAGEAGGAGPTRVWGF